ncbi:MAG: VIT domain-containing protein [Gammaproteobacteria bacterium]|nr:VIT domain-containing protein [Gammaproteobacteria bacterium]
MKRKNSMWLTSLVMLFGGLYGAVAQAAGLLTPKDGSLPALSIKTHQVQVTVEDGYAITQVEQVFHNPHARDLEAIYSFPVPEKGSVAEFTLWIDGKPVTGEVLEREQARTVYEEEKAAGRDAGLTEKDSYKTFEVSVSPVRAGQDTRIRLVYLQPAHIDTGIGRYVYPLEEGGVDERKLAFWTANDNVMEQFSFKLNLKSSYPVDAVRVPNEPNAQVAQAGNGEWKVQIGNRPAAPLSNVNPSQGAQEEEAPAQTQNGLPVYTLDKDLVVYWRHKEGLPGSVDLIAHKPDSAKRGTFMLVVTPGDDLKPISQGKDWVFVLDMSGSMQSKYATLAEGVKRALNKMRPDDRFRIVFFNNTAHELTSGYVNATPDSIRNYADKVTAVKPNGSTNMFAGVKMGLDALDADRTSAIVLVTDGVANVGETEQRKFIELLKQKDVRLFTAVMGNSANRPLLDAMTKASHGFAVSVSNSDDIVGQILTMSSKVTHEALHGVKLKIKGVKTADVEPQEIGSLYRGQQLVIFGHYWGDGPADVSLSGKISGQPVTYRTTFNFPSTAQGNPEIERLWAFAAIEGMMEEINNFGENADIKKAVVDLGVEYGLVTDYTSMVVVRDEVFESRGIKRLNRERLMKEHAAQQARAQRPAQSRRVDNSQPMYQSSRASHGSGALDASYLLLLLPLIWHIARRRREEELRA